MSTSRVRAIATLAFAVAAAIPTLAHASITLLNPTIAVGRVAPETVRLMPVTTLIISDEPWRLSLLLDRQQSRCERAAACSDRIDVRIASGEWLPLKPELPTVIGEGSPTRRGGTPVTFQLRFTTSWDSPIGVHDGVIRCDITGAPAVPLRYKLEVDPTVLLISDEVPFKSPSVNPAVKNRYDYEPRSFTLRSNVPWVVEVSIREPLKAAGSSKTIKGDPLLVMTADGRSELLAPGRPPVVVAAGSATGAAPSTVLVRLAAQTPDAGVAAGAYRTDLVIEARPQR